MKTVNLTHLTKQEILKISLKSPEKLFLEVNTEKEIKDAYIKLSFKWHPDKNLNAIEKTDDVFAHINLLYKKAKDKFKNNTWNKGSLKEFVSLDNKKTIYSYVNEYEFELGYYLIAANSVAWVISPDFEDLALNAIKQIENIKYASDKMKSEMQKFVPKITSFIRTQDKQTVVIMERDPNSVLLKDALAYYTKVDAKHVAWILSNCYHLCCFLEYNKLMHGGLTIDSLFINPENHASQLLGGWWFTHRQNDKLRALSAQTLSIAPFNVINSKIALGSLDLECIRLIGRQLLGDKNGINLVKNKDIPTPLTQWLRGASTEDAFKEYDIWYKVLKDSFGVRRFTKMELNPNDIYN